VLFPDCDVAADEGGVK